MRVAGSRRVVRGWSAASAALLTALACAACGSGPSTGRPGLSTSRPGTPAAATGVATEPAPAPEETAHTLVPSDLTIHQDLREQFQHGPKPAEYQKYIVLHDTETTAGPEGVISSWAGSDRLVAAHFVVGRDGSVWQTVPMDVIAHHAGYGDTGHDEFYGVPEDGRDDMLGSTPIGRWAADYGMNAYSVGIEMVHVGGQDYPQAQLDALDRLIAYVDAYYGFDSTIIDHKAWRSGNSDTSPQFAGYLAAYQDHRTHQ